MSFREEENYLAYLEQRQLIRNLSQDDDGKAVDKLFFQEMVLENLTPEERQRYMCFLLEPRAKTAKEMSLNRKLSGRLNPEESGLMEKMKHLTHRFNRLP